MTSTVVIHVSEEKTEAIYANFATLNLFTLYRISTLESSDLPCLPFIYIDICTFMTFFIRAVLVIINSKLHCKY